MKEKVKIFVLLIIAMYFGYRSYKIFFYNPDIDFEKMQLKTLDNKNFQLNHTHLQSTIIVFFQTWCGPCVSEMKLIQKNYRMFSFTKIYFISDESSEKLYALKNRLRLDSVNILFYHEKLVSIGIESFPTSYIIKNNEIMETHKGAFIDENNFEGEIFHLQKILE